MKSLLRSEASRAAVKFWGQSLSQGIILWYTMSKLCLLKTLLRQDWVLPVNLTMENISAPIASNTVDCLRLWTPILDENRSIVSFEVLVTLGTAWQIDSSLALGAITKLSQAIVYNCSFLWFSPFDVKEVEGSWQSLDKYCASHTLPLMHRIVTTFSL